MRQSKPIGYSRGGNDEVLSIPAVWIDIDTSDGKHSAINLPQKKEGLSLLESFGIKPTMIVDSGGGYHIV
ncbi:hypothetical protein [Salipaludibacillus neizhouensis]|uniref:hypothetical protein n=1 Tax=Salipaludibacillus neizhouensis TaxID=885475 RepID=UPI0011C38461|nr:hypothetical protein [Salipaludibacillus neizhouensis]